MFCEGVEGREEEHTSPLHIITPLHNPHTKSSRQLTDCIEPGPSLISRTHPALPMVQPAKYNVILLSCIRLRE